MKIGILGDPLDTQSAGIHQYVKQFVAAAAQLDQQNEYVLIRFQDGEPISGVRQIVVPDALSAKNPWRLWHKIPKVLKREQVDAVFEPAHFGPFNLPDRIKRITMIHDLTTHLYPEFHPWARAYAHQLLLPGILKRADVVLANSACTQQDLEGWYPFTHGKVDFIHLGTDSFFSPGDGSAVRQELQIEGPFFLAVGTIEPRKNLVTLLDAYHEYRTQNTGTTPLIIAGGSGWKSKSFEQALASHPFKQDIQVLGFVPKETLRNLYREAHALIYPSHYEGFGIPLAEAMACGCPILVSTAPSLLEVGDTACLSFPPEDASALVAQMQAINDEAMRQKLIEAGLARVQQLSWSNYIESWKQLIETRLLD